VLAQTQTTGRHAAVRQRHRRAIIDAAATLLEENGADGFTVDALATRADVSRRTIFNHFATIDDVVIAVCSEILGTIVESFEQHAKAARPRTEDGSGTAAVFDEVADAVRQTDLVRPMVHLTEVLGSSQAEPTPRQAMLLLRAFTEVSERLSAHILLRHDAADALTVRLLVGSLMSGLVVLHRHWFELTGGRDDHASRRVWAELLDKLILHTRDGFRDPAPEPITAPTSTRSPARRNSRG
jgi:AcrR family transcriptional regulator